MKNLPQEVKNGPHTMMTETWFGSGSNPMRLFRGKRYGDLVLSEIHSAYLETDDPDVMLTPYRSMIRGMVQPRIHCQLDLMTGEQTYFWRFYAVFENGTPYTLVQFSADKSRAWRGVVIGEEPPTNLSEFPPSAFMIRKSEIRCDELIG